MMRYRSFRVLTGILLFLCLGALSLFSEEDASSIPDTIRIGVFCLSPFMMTDENDSAGGAAIDFWREYLAPRMNAVIEVSGPYPIPRLEIMLERGEIDVIPYITKIPDRQVRFRYPENPLTTISSCIIVRKDSLLETIQSQEDLFDMKIGFITSAFIPPFFKHKRIELELITATEFREINHRKLMNGRVDALLDINHVSLVYEMNQKGYSKDIRIIPVEQDITSIYSIFSRNARGKMLSDKYDLVMSGLPDGIFEKITERYLDD